jgi:hypothetical protein
MIEGAFRIGVFPCKPEQAFARNDMHTTNIAQILNDATVAFVKTVRTLAASGR